MIQSDALSRRPDFIPEEDHDNENRILLPEEMFVNLIDTDLQDRIANSTNYDFDVKNALEMLLEKGPNTLQNDLENWKNIMEETLCFTKEKIISQMIWNYEGTLSKCSMIMKQQDTLVNWKHSIQSNNTIGGQECGHLSNDTYRGVESVNNSK